MALEARGITACVLNSASRTTISEACSGEYAIVYTTPETLLRYAHELGGAQIDYIAVDEAHCVSQWGHDFRPEFRQISTARRAFANVPLIALTATATPQVQEDIRACLTLDSSKSTASWHTVSSTFNRPNLHYSVRSKSTTVADMRLVFDFLRKANHGSPGPAIVYVMRRKDTESIASTLRNILKIDARSYHAGMSPDERSAVHKGFLNDDIAVVVATVAFGMGIDKPDVRMVVHYGPSKSVEAYYQETGRAGRDGQQSYCVLFSVPSDYNSMRGLVASNTSDEIAQRNVAMVDKLQELPSLGPTQCRRQFLLSYFGEVPAAPANQSAAVVTVKPPKPCGGASCCDGCDAFNVQATGSGPDLTHDFTKEARILCEAIQFCGPRAPSSEPVSTVMGSKAQKFVTKYGSRLDSCGCYGKGGGLPKIFWQGLAQMLVNSGHITANTMQSGGWGRKISWTVFALTPEGHAFVRTATSTLPKMLVPADMQSIVFKERQQRERIAAVMAGGAAGGAAAIPAPAAAVATRALTDSEESLLESLKAQRQSSATQLQVAPYAVCSEAALDSMVRHRPTTLEGLELMPGVGVHQIKQWGGGMVQVIELMSSVLGLSTNVDPTAVAAAAARERDLSAGVAASRAGAAAAAGGISSAIQDLAAAPALREVTITPTQQEACELLQQGLSVQQVAEHKGVKLSTAHGYICNCLAAGYAVDIKRLGFAQGFTSPDLLNSPHLLRSLVSAARAQAGQPGDFMRVRKAALLAAVPGAEGAYTAATLVCACLTAGRAEELLRIADSFAAQGGQQYSRAPVNPPSSPSKRPAAATTVKTSLGKKPRGLRFGAA